MDHFLAVSDLSPAEVQGSAGSRSAIEKGVFRRGESTIVQRESAGHDLPETQPADARLV